MKENGEGRDGMAGGGEAEAGEMAWVERGGKGGEGRIGGVAEAKDGLQGG